MLQHDPVGRVLICRQVVGTNLYLVMSESLLQLLKPNFGRNHFTRERTVM